ncbi:hypothetical protein L6164_025857 [Bauhinia variegata]|uniref:Uncharacterized protein n=1 Tax=Bauhinia variegata TaxID=167791 RepID=A0ACB9M279_BAUVA|nr:hypothetical protein L6164_025857 [Bauhinia variegata]
MANNYQNLIRHPYHVNGFPFLCRFCNHFISSNAALINHIEFHIQQQEVTLRSQNPVCQAAQQRGPIGNRFPNNVPVLRPMEAPSQSVAMDLVRHAQPTRHLSSFVGRPLILQNLREMRESPKVHTKPLIQLLDHPIKKIEFIDLVEGDDPELDLKL